MAELTKEWLLKTIAELEEDRDAVPGTVNEDAAMALAAMKLALASLDAEPVGFIARHKETGKFGSYLHPKADWFKNDDYEVLSAYTAPPAPVSVPAAMEMDDDFDSAFEHGKAVGWNAYRAAMLQGAKPVTTAYKLRDAVETIRNSGIEIDAEKIFAERDALNAPDCWCRTCRPVTISDMRFVVCPECGNKRCPHANDHRNACTGSNEPGQEGSAYPAAPQQEVTQALAKGMERYGDAMRELAKKEEK
ncbi:hypothetical protein [Enterobacter hormaechei]|uniref:hypothetical protein n=1 Tax=Enterobacter hormaechei TaxID=158836 RepID=UPI001F3EC08D|nr:hypothetical protein [Enterobacter hormaechei]